MVTLTPPADQRFFGEIFAEQTYLRKKNAATMTTLTPRQLQDFIEDVLVSLHANIRDLEEKRTFADPEEHAYLDGRLFSYVEVLAILRVSAYDTGIDPKDIGV